MSTPVIQVLVGFQTTAGFGQPFQLNDATFGLLDTGTLGGLAFADLTNLVEFVSIARGRNRELDQFNAGTATVTFDNATRVLDPLNDASIYYPFVLPRAPIQILANGVPIYTGLVVDWNLDYDISNQDKMYANCSDVFTVLANQSMEAFTPSAETSSVRVSTVLDRPEIQYQGARNIGTGSSTLGAFAVTENTNVLNYLQLVTKSEQGYIYISADGTLTYKGRTQVLNPVANADFTSDGTGVNYQTLVNEFGDELLYNDIVTESPAGGPFNATDSTSQALYQSQQYAATDLLNSTASQVEALGQYLLGKYKNPVLRFTGVTTQLAALSTAQQNDVLALDLTDIATVEKTYVTGTPASVTQTLIVSGVRHTITPQNHIIGFSFESTDGNQYLTLDDPIFGTLDNNLLSF
jgi:biopolymer transport protein ExbD